RSLVLLYLHSFPTRRSSDLLLFHQPSTPHAVDVLRAIVASQVNLIPCTQAISAATRLGRMLGPNTAWVGPGAIGPCATSGYDTRSEEHTSEPQSRENLVCRL